MIQGKVVAPSTPRTRKGLYWGYNVRLVEKLSQVFTKSPFKGGYDLTLGTSERGDNIDNCQQLSKASQINEPTQKVKHFGFLRPIIVKLKNLTIPTFLSGYFPSSAGGIGRCKRPGVGRGERRPTEGRGLRPKQAVRHLSQHLPKPGKLLTQSALLSTQSPLNI